jgi:hypothetical protein
MVTLGRVYRRIAEAPMAHVVVGYAACISVVSIARDVGQQHHAGWLTVTAAIVGVVVQSLLITVVALYQDDDVFLAAMIIVLISGVGILVAQSLAILVQSGSIGPAFVLAAGAAMTLFLRALLLVPLCAGLVWLLRRFRRFIAPDTMETSRHA